MSNYQLDYVILSETLDNLENLRDEILEYLEKGWEVLDTSIILQPNMEDKQFCVLQKIK